MRGVLAFSLFGIFVGSLCGLSLSPVTLTLMPLLFTFAGGSIFAFFGRMSDSTRNAAYVALGSASLGALLGTYSAIWISSHQLLGPLRDFSASAPGYLRSNEVENVEHKITELEQQGKLSAQIASEIRVELYKK